MAASWRIQLFGGLRAEQGDQVITRFRMQKAAALLGYLAYYRQRTHPREVLVELLWPDCDVDVGRRRLSVALSLLRGQLELPGVPGGIFAADHFSVGLNAAVATTDVEQFEAAVRSAAVAVSPDERVGLLEQAVELYRGPLLAGFYEDWILTEQQRLEELLFQALRQLITSLVQEGRPDRALQHALRAVSLDPTREETHRELIRLYAAVGQPDAALRQYRELERILQQELGEPPSEATRSLVAEIGQSGVQVFRSSGVQDRQTASVARTPDHLNTRSPEHPVTPSPLHPFTPSAALEPVGGAVPLESPFYVERPRDAEFRAAIARRDSVVLVKGAQGVGKTSLLARGLHQAREAGARVVQTDLDKLAAAHLASDERFFLTLAEEIADQLDLEVAPDAFWHPRRLPTVNLERYLSREVLGKIPVQVVWGLDGVDRLFEYDFGSEAFRLFRSWHNERALDPSGPWGRLTLAIAYATEVNLFIRDLNQSPFNVGTRLTLEDFTVAEVADLNARYGSPLSGETEVERLHRLVGGHPLLVRRGMHEMATRGIPLDDLESRAAGDGGIFRDHLQRIQALLARDPELCAVMRELLQGRPCTTPTSFYRLRTAGVVTGDSARDARPRCPLYATYLERHLLDAAR